MTLDLFRTASSDDGTVGKLSVDGVFFCYTMEPDEDRAQYPAIPVGSYPVTINRSTRFGRLLPLIVGVPGRLGIRIHPGNTEDDTDGCILLGLAHTPDTVMQSRAACDLFQAKIAPVLAAGGTVTLTITEADA